MLRLLAGFAIVTAVLVGFLGCQGQKGPGRPLMIFFDMVFQPKYQAQGESAYFENRMAMRPQVPGTIAFSGNDYETEAGKLEPNPDFLQEDEGFYTGKVGEEWLGQMPVSFDRVTLARGQQRFKIYCSVCHGMTGAGTGIVSEYNFVGIANLLDKRIQDMPDGEIFATISNGKGLMASYATQIKPADRWAIVAYLRALQLSQNSKIDDVPQPYRAELEKQ